MKKVIIILTALLTFAGLSAQNNDTKNLECYKELVKLTHKSYETGTQKLNSWGYTVQKDGIINMFTLQMIPFINKDVTDSTGFGLSVLENNTIIGMSFRIAGSNAEQMYARGKKIFEAQNGISEKQGFSFYSAVIKGKGKPKMSQSYTEMLKMIEETPVEDVKQIVVMWKSADKKSAASFIYENHRYGKKKPRETDAIEVTISQTAPQEM